MGPAQTFRTTPCRSTKTVTGSPGIRYRSLATFAARSSPIGNVGPRFEIMRGAGSPGSDAGFFVFSLRQRTHPKGQERASCWRGEDKKRPQESDPSKPRRQEDEYCNEATPHRGPLPSYPFEPLPCESKDSISARASGPSHSLGP